MTVAFNRIANTQRAPGSYTEFSNEGANQGVTLKAYRALIVGQVLASSSVEAGKMVQISRKEQVVGLAGAGSQLALAAAAWFANKGDQIETWALPLADDAAAAAATGSIKITGTVQETGVLSVYVGGELVRVAAVLNDTNSAVATKLATAINANMDLPVTAEAAADTVTLTAKNKGAVGNELDVRLNYYPNDEKTPVGLSVAITAFSGGAANPMLEAALAGLGDKQFDVIVCPFTDGGSLLALETEMEDRWGPMRAIDGMVFVGKGSNYADLSTLGNSRNSPFVCIGGLPKCPNQAYVVAAATAGQAAFAAQNDPARPFQTLQLVGVLAPKQTDLLTDQERNLLLFNGISTYRVNAGGEVQIEMLVTTYKVGDYGQVDDSYLMVNTIWTLSYLRYDWDAYIVSKYPRHKLADDGNKFARGQPIMTPKLMHAEMVARATLWSHDLGLVENVEQFTADSFAERHGSNPNRLDSLMVPDLVNQMCVFANKIQFKV